MNSLQASDDPSERPATAAEPGALSRISAYMDGALPAADVPDDLGSAELSDAWHRYHLIGEALRAAPSTPFLSSVDALSAAAARQTAASIIQQARSSDASAPWPEAAQQPAPAVVIQVVRHQEAANDGVFRWKLVAGLASVVAVLGVVWGLSGVPGALPGGAELAANPTPTVVVQASAGGATRPVADTLPAAASVLVSTPNGQMLRDPRLEVLMQAHRQAGGALALQVPAGFMRNATFESPQR